MHRIRNGVTVAAAVAMLVFEPLGGQARADVPDGGPGGACQIDSDCGICGWVCSTSRGGICVPAIEGAPGHCAANSQCGCAGQICDGGVCLPEAKPLCWCNGDCPAGQICDQLLFDCHPPSPIYCGRNYDGYVYGAPAAGPACGCNGICGESGGLLVCQAQLGTLPTQCASDLDCGSCYQKLACVGGACVAATEAGWCSGPRDVIADSSADGGSAGAKGGCGMAGATCPAMLALVLALAARQLRRRVRARSE